MVRLSNMKATLSPSDIFEIRKTSVISSNDYEYALDLYAPIIGIKRLSVYFALIAENGGQQMPVSGFLSKYNLPCGEMSGALSYLEAVGLVKSYRKILGNSYMYLFSVMAPLTPDQFLKNEVLFGALRSFLGINGCRRIAGKYVPASPIDESYEDISERFVDVLNIDLSKASIIQSPDASARVSGKLQLGFDNNVFMSTLIGINPFIKPGFITKGELERIGRIAALYNYEESAMASFVVDVYKPTDLIGRRIDFDRLNDIAQKNAKYEYLHKEDMKPSSSEIHGSAPTAKVIRMMDNKTTIEFLTILQRGNKPAPADLDLANLLTSEMGVPQNVVNALFFYVICIKEDSPSKAYMTKLGAALVRAEITNALDALNYLGGQLSKSNKKHGGKKQPEKPVVEEKPATEEAVEETEEEDISEEEFEALMKNRSRK